MRKTSSAIRYGGRRTAFTIVLTMVLFIGTGTAPSEAQSADRPRQLENGESNFYEDRVETNLAPDSPFVDRIQTELQALDPRVGIEIVLDIPVTDEAFTDAGRLTIYNILRSVHSMEGIEYYSASRDEMRTFYHESYAIAGPDDDTRVPDPTVERVPDTSELWAYQRDGSFGRNVQRLHYTARNGSILVSMENETTMVYKVVPLVTPGNLRTFLLVQPNADERTVTFYGNLAVRVPALFGMQDRARDSFYNRIVALHDWFLQELERAGLADE